MESTLNYNFERKSKSFFDWLYYTIKSEKYSEAEAEILACENER